MMTDSKLKRDVENELRWDPRVNEAHMGVSVKDGVVTLSGHVPSYFEKFAAERAAKRVYGVKAVADELQVKFARGHKRSDEDIATACVAALGSNLAVPAEKVQVVVRDGFVILDGEVEWQYQSDSAEAAVRPLAGVTGVANKLKIHTHVTPQDVKAQIEEAFRRSAEIDSQGIIVTAVDHKVILSGKVRSWAEREEAQKAAWAAPGVTAVENDILVTPESFSNDAASVRKLDGDAWENPEFAIQGPDADHLRGIKEI